MPWRRSPERPDCQPRALAYLLHFFRTWPLMTMTPMFSTRFYAPGLRLLAPGAPNTPSSVLPSEIR
jgi:hypothetical protein